MAILGNNSVPNTRTDTNPDRIYVNKYTAPSSFSVTDLHAYVSGSGAFRLVVYDATGTAGDPGNLVCKTADLSVSSGGLGVYVEVSGAPTVAATLNSGVDYWIGLHFGASTNGLGQNSGTSWPYAYVTGKTFASGPPAAFGTPSGSGSTSVHTVWAVVTVSAGGGGGGSILERKAGAASVDSDDYNALVDAVVALGGTVTTRKAGSGQVNTADYNAVVDAVVALGGTVRDRKAGAAAVDSDDYNALVDAVKLLGAA